MKFLSMIASSSLYFARLNTLGDPFEGTFPKANHEAHKNRHIKTKNYVVNYPHAAKLAAYYLARHFYLSCWHGSDYESDAMWKLYLKSHEGIAIQSTTHRLTESFKSCEHKIYVGCIKYIDYTDQAILNDRGTLNGFDAIVHKRHCFEHEKEIRAFLSLDGRSEETPVGVSIPVNIDVLAENFYVAPTTPDWQFDLFKAVIEKYGIKVPVLRSSLTQSPIDF